MAKTIWAAKQAPLLSGCVFILLRCFAVALLTLVRRLAAWLLLHCHLFFFSSSIYVLLLQSECIDVLLIYLCHLQCLLLSFCLFLLTFFLFSCFFRWSFMMTFFSFLYGIGVPPSLFFYWELSGLFPHQSSCFFPICFHFYPLCLHATHSCDCVAVWNLLLSSSPASAFRWAPLSSSSSSSHFPQVLLVRFLLLSFSFPFGLFFPLDLSQVTNSGVSLLIYVQNSFIFSVLWSLTL